MGKILDRIGTFFITAIIAIVVLGILAIILGFIFMFAWNNSVAVIFDLEPICFSTSIWSLLLISFFKSSTTNTTKTITDSVKPKLKRKVKKQEFKLQKIK